MSVSDLDQVLTEALSLGDEGRWQEMAEVLSAALDEAPDDPYILGWLGVAEQELGNDTQAYEYFRRCLAEEPLDPHLLALAGSGLAGFDDPEAESALRAAALSGPDVPMARLQYGAWLARAGLFTEALEHLEAARQLAPDDASIASELGTAYALKGDHASAETAFETALRLAPDDGWTRVLLGLVQLEQGDLEDAAENLLRASQASDQDGEAALLAALAAGAMDWREAAEAALVRAQDSELGVEETLLEEVRERIDDGPRSARDMLVQDVAPSALRERLSQPL